MNDQLMMSPRSAPTALTLRDVLARDGKEFVRAAYWACLGREADPDGLAHYARRLSEGTLKIDILQELQESNEGRRSGKSLAGMPPLRQKRWRDRMPLLRRIVSDRDAATRAWAMQLELDAFRQETLRALGLIAERLDQQQRDIARRLADLENWQLLEVDGNFVRDQWEAIRTVLGLHADRFIHEAFQLALQRAPQPHEIRHFRHLQAVGLPARALLASLISCPESCARRESRTADQAVVESMRSTALLSPDPAPQAPPSSALIDQLLTDLRDVSFHPEAEPVASVVIPVYGKVDYTLRCLISIARNRGRHPFEVIVVDDKSPDGSGTLLQGIFGLELLLNEVNLGFVRSCNRGAASSRGRYVCFLNNDTEVRSGWLDELIDTFAQFPAAGLVGSKLVYPDGTLQEAGGIVWKDASAWNYGRNQDPSRAVFNYARETDYCSGASILVDKELFERVGKFDERYVPAYYEDTSLAFAVRAAGRQVIYQPKSEVIHHEGVSNGTDVGSGIKAYQVTNHRQFHDLWRQVLETEHFPNAEHVPLARDRSVFKRIVLVVDHYVPQPDRDAGSRSMWHIMRVLQSHGFLVKFWPENLWRDPVYVPMLERAGIEVMYGAEYGGRFEDWMREHGGYLDGVILSRPHIAVNFIDAVRRHTRAPILYYGHDIHHLRLQRQLALKFDPQVQKAMEAVERQEKELWEKADTVIYPSEEETRHVEPWLRKRKLAARARTIPVYAFDSFPDAPWANLSERRNLMFVAGFGHPPNSGAAVWFVQEVLPKIRAARPDIRLTLIGSNPTPEVQALAGDQIVVTGYVTDEVLARHYEVSRVAVAPLLYGGGMKGKVVEAIRNGIPCVTSPVGAQGLEAAADCLAVAGTPDEYARMTLELLDDDALWLRRSQSGLAFARRYLSTQALWEVFSAELNSTPFETMQDRLRSIDARQSNR